MSMFLYIYSAARYHYFVLYFNIVLLLLVSFGLSFLFVFFFFFKQKTAYEMRISDWSSDVCSSDLLPLGGILRRGRVRGERQQAGGRQPQLPLADRAREQSPAHQIHFVHRNVHPDGNGCFVFATRRRNPYRSGTLQSIIA